MIGPLTTSQEVPIQTGAGPLHFEVMSIPLLQPNGWRSGQIFIVENTTQLWQAQQQQVQTAWAQATFQEREQLANELHDGLSQNLAFLNLQAQTAQVYLQNQHNEAARASLERLTADAEKIQNDTRELINILMSERLPVENFFTAMQEIVENFERRSSLDAVLNLETNGYPAESGEECFGPTRLPPHIAVQLVRITQEALANVRKHAGSTTQVNVRLKASEGEVLLVIEDNGEGFDPAAVESSELHFGLRVMRNRAERIGGQVFLYSRPGEGTRVEVSVPVAGDT
jgi:two-component system, NarL family, nitrate/nitrite sensor histidine kinase NarX